jgi:hypothetical protein
LLRPLLGILQCGFRRDYPAKHVVQFFAADLEDLADFGNWRAWPELKLIAPGHLVNGLEDWRCTPHFRVCADRVTRIGAAAVFDVELLGSRGGEDDQRFRGGLYSLGGYVAWNAHHVPAHGRDRCGLRPGRMRQETGLAMCRRCRVELEIGGKQCVAIGHGDFARRVGPDSLVPGH